MPKITTNSVRLCLRVTPALAAALRHDKEQSKGEEDLSRIVRRILSAHYFNRRPARAARRAT